jgi:hypothetical protein
MEWNFEIFCIDTTVLRYLQNLVVLQVRVASTMMMIDVYTQQRMVKGQRNITLLY